MIFSKRSLASAITNITQSAIKLIGGLDEVTPHYERKPGAVRASQNFEAGVNGGYISIEGYERFSGKAKPSAATYTVVQVASFTNTPAVNDILSGTSGGAHAGTVIAVGSNYVVVTLKTGTGAYVVGETVTIPAGNVGVVATLTASISALLNAQYLNLAADVYRALIEAPTGSGSILGGFYFNNVNYCFRGTGLFKESATGWIPAIQFEMAFTSGGTYTVADGNTITGETSGATAVITSVILKSGTWAGGNAAGVFVFASQTGTFTAAETVKVGANLDVATVTSAAAASLLYEIAFTVGAVAIPAAGETLTRGSITATLKRVVLTSGTFAGGNAAGRFIVTNPAGGSFTAGAATLSAATCTLGGAQTAITLLAAGRYETIKHNFGGLADSFKVYGADGINRAFEFDGTVFVPIATGMASDTPKHIFAHKNHLFLSFGGSAQHSGVGTPYIWTTIVGAGELALGDVVTGFAAQAGSETSGALAIFTRNRTSMLYGTAASGSGAWQLTTYRDELGAWAYTVQDIGHTVFLDDRGITDIQSTQAYGNFAHNAISSDILPFITTNKPNAIASSISREKSQYRLFFTNSKALYITMVGKKVIGIMPVLFSNAVTATWTAETNGGDEVMFFGSTNGMVYQMDKGTSFDGAAIKASFDLAYNYLGSPRVDKSFYDVTAEVSGEGYTNFEIGYALGYGSSDTPQPALQTSEVNLTGVYWGSFVWGSFTWGGTPLTPITLPMSGMAENVSFSVRVNSDYTTPLKFNSLLVNYTPRRKLRY